MEEDSRSRELGCDPYIKSCGSCKVLPKTFFQELGMKHTVYEITGYIYSSNTSNLIPKLFTKYIRPDGPWNPVVNCMGYVGISNDETTARLEQRDVVITWRGTVTKMECMEDLMYFLKPVLAQKLAIQGPNSKVTAIFIQIKIKAVSIQSSRSAHAKLLAEITRLTKIYGPKGEEISITITGHSLGSALAILSAYDIAESNLDKQDSMQRFHIYPCSHFLDQGLATQGQQTFAACTMMKGPNVGFQIQIPVSDRVDTKCQFKPMTVIYIMGNQAYSNGDLAKAEDYYMKGLNSVSQNEKSRSCLEPLMLCYSNRATTSISLGRMKEVLGDCLTASNIDTGFLKAHVRAVV
ncbi:phospholipase A1-Igamma1, chloroplastic-like protein [Tanacetum coccineum]